MPEGLLQLLRNANAQIGAFLKEVDAGTAGEIKRCPAIGPLLCRLEEVGISLRKAPKRASADPDLQTEIAHYTDSLERLKPALETVGRRLLERRSQLELQQRQMLRVGRWAAATQSIEPSFTRKSTWGITLAD